MFNKIQKSDLFSDYYSQWIKVYKEGAIRDVTMSKYKMTLSWVERLVPNLQLENLNERSGLYDYGYNVSTPTISERRNVLNKIISVGIYSKYDVISFLKWNINNKRHQKNACLEWQSDIEYIKRYFLR